MSNHRPPATANAVIGDMEAEDSASNAASDNDDYWAEADDAIFDASSPTSRESWNMQGNIMEHMEYEENEEELRADESSFLEHQIKQTI